MSVREELTAFGFQRVGVAVLDAGDSQIRFELDAESAFNESADGIVYVLVSKLPDNPDDLKVRFAGHTTEGLAKALLEHQLQLKRKDEARELLQRVYFMMALKKDGIIEIWANVSDTLTIYGQSVSLCAAGERAIIERYKPDLNRRH